MPKLCVLCQTYIDFIYCIFTMSRPRGILVTGAHRSGSTWVGRMLAHSHEVQYIHEPFNLKCRQGICRAEFKKWYCYVDNHSDNRQAVYTALSDTLSFRYALGAALGDIENAKDIIRTVRDSLQMGRGRLFNLRPLMKDPLALFSTEWLSNGFGMDVVILIRHPAAFVSSLKVKGWSFPFHHLLEQPALMERYLSPFRNEVYEYSKNEKDIISQAILLWKITHYVISQYQENHPNWLYLRHEDLSRNPLDEFSKLYSQLGLDFTSDIQNKIKLSSGSENPTETSRNIHNVKRDSAANIWNWQKRLSKDDIYRIYDEVGDISSLFYKDNDWALSALAS